MRTTHVNKSLPVELGEDIVVKSYKRGSPEAAMPIIDPKPSYLILSYLKQHKSCCKFHTLGNYSLNQVTQINCTTGVKQVTFYCNPPVNIFLSSR